MSISYKSRSRKEEGTNDRPFSQVRNVSKLILEGIWDFHKSFRSVVMKELISGHWLMFFAKLPRHDITGGLITKVDDVWLRELKADITDLSRNLRNITLKTFTVKSCDHDSINFTINNISFKVIGVGKKLMMELAKRLNIHWFYMQELIGLQVEMNVTPQLNIANKLALAIWLGKIDFSPILFIYGDLSWTEMHVISGSVQEIRTVVLVPRSLPLPSWSLPIRVFGPVVWSSLMGTALVYALAWRVVAGESLAASAAAALRAFSSCGGAPQDRVRATPQRLQLAGALLASAVVVIAIYQGRIFTLITNPEYHAEIDTFDQLAESGLVVMGPQDFRVQLDLNSSHITQQERAARTRAFKLQSHVAQSNAIANKVLRGVRLAWADSDLIWDVYSRCHNISERMRPMRETLGTTLGAMHGRPNFAWTEIINQKYLQFQSAGLFLKWKDDMDSSFAIYQRSLGFFWNEVSTSDNDNEDDPRKLTLDDVIPNLQLLGAGLILATLVFCEEVLRGYRKNTRC